MNEVISSGNNVKIKYLKKLYDKKKRKEEGKFILEGFRIIEEAVKAKADLEVVFMTPQFSSSNEGLVLSKEIGQNCSIILITDSLLRKIASTQNPQGVIAVVREMKYNLNDFFNRTEIILVLDRIQDPGNLGTIIRTAVAAGVDRIITLKGTVDIYNLKVLRSTMGAIFNIPIITELEFSNFKKIVIEQVKNYQLICADLSGDKYYHQVEYNKPVILVIGNEARGIRPEILRLADYSIKIPLIGKIESLNAAIATGVILYEISKKKEILG